MRSDKVPLASADDRPATGSRAFRLRRSASAELGAAVRLFALAPHDLGLAARHESAVETKVEGESVAELAFDDAAFIPGYLVLKSPAVAFYRLEARRRAAAPRGNSNRALKSSKLDKA